MSKSEFIGRDHEIVNLKNWRGKIIVMYFWAPWLPECMHDMQHLNALDKLLMEQEESDIVILPIMVTGLAKKADNIMERAEAFYAIHKIDSLPIYLDYAGAYHSGLHVTGGAVSRLLLPLAIVVDKRGREVGRIGDVINKKMPITTQTIRDIKICACSGP